MQSTATVNPADLVGGAYRPAGALRRRLEALHNNLQQPWVAWVVFLLALAWALAFAWGLGRIYREEEAIWEQELIAEHIVNGHGFASPLDRTSASPPTTYSPPLYPYFISAVYRFVGVNTPAAQAILVHFNIVFFALMVLGVYLLGRRIFFGEAGLAAVALTLTNKFFLEEIGMIWNRMASTTAMVWIMLWALWLSQRRPTWRAMLLFGAALGVLSLLDAGLVLAYPVLVLLALRKVPWRKKVIGSAVALAGWAIALTPWTVRNYIEFDRLFYIRAGYALELWNGNIPISSGVQTYDVLQEHPFNHPAERKLMLEMGEIAYFELCQKRFDEMYRADPAAFWSKTWNRVVYWIMGDTTSRGGTEYRDPLMWKNHYIQLLIYLPLMFALGAVGFYVAWRLRYRAMWLLGLGLLAGVPYVFTHVSRGYWLPMRLVMMLAGGLLLAVIWERVRTGLWREAEPAA